MPATRIIQDPEAFHLPSKWERLPENSRVVDPNGNVVGKGYVGQRYTVLCDAKLSLSAYKKRRFRAIVTIIFTFGFAYCCPKLSKRIKSLLAQKQVLFIAPREVSLEDAEAELGSGMQIPQEASNRIQELIPVITKQCSTPKKISLEDAKAELKKGMSDRFQELIVNISKKINDNEITIIDNYKFTKFIIPEAPEFIFTLGSKPDDELLIARFNAIVFRKSVIMNHHLDLLQVPDTTLFKIPTDEGDLLLMAERCLSCNADHYFQEDLYHRNQEGLKPIVKQLTKFIYEARLTGVNYQTCPLLDNEEGPLKCGILNVEREVSCGLYSLIRMMPNVELIDLVIEACKKFSSDFDFIGAKEIQLGEIAGYNAYQKFLEERNIQSGDEPVVSPEDMKSVIETLGIKYGKVGFSLSMKGMKSNILKEDVENIINGLNASILDNENLHKEKKRLVHLDINTDNLNQAQRELYLLDVECILGALVEKGYIFNCKKHAENLFEVQC